MTITPQMVFALEGIAAGILFIWQCIEFGGSVWNKIFGGILYLLFCIASLWIFNQVVWLFIGQSINPWWGTVITAIGLCLMILILIKWKDIDLLDSLFLTLILVSLGPVVITDGYLLQRPAPTIAAISISPTKYSIGDRGEVTISLINNSTYDISIKQISLLLPENFFDGFIIEYPALSLSAKVKNKDFWSAANIEFPAIELLAGEDYEIKIPIVANSSGDYSGLYIVRISELPLLGANRYFREPINVIVLP